MGGIDCPANEKVNVGGLLEKQAGNERRSVPLNAPLVVHFVVSQRVLGIFDDLIYGYNALGNKVDSLYLGNRRYIAPLKIETGL